MVAAIGESNTVLELKNVFGVLGTRWSWRSCRGDTVRKWKPCVDN